MTLPMSEIIPLEIRRADEENFMEALLSRKPEPAVLLEQVRCTDMRAFVNAAWQGFDQRMKDQGEPGSKAMLCGTVAHFSERSTTQCPT